MWPFLQLSVEEEPVLPMLPMLLLPLLLLQPQDQPRPALLPVKGTITEREWSLFLRRPQPQRDFFSFCAPDSRKADAAKRTQVQEVRPRRRAGLVSMMPLIAPREAGAPPPGR